MWLLSVRNCRSLIKSLLFQAKRSLFSSQKTGLSELPDSQQNHDVAASSEARVRHCCWSWHCCAKTLCAVGSRPTRKYENVLRGRVRACAKRSDVISASLMRFQPGESREVMSAPEADNRKSLVNGGATARGRKHLERQQRIMRYFTNSDPNATEQHRSTGAWARCE